jgi:hypothetical protein
MFVDDVILLIPCPPTATATATATATPCTSNALDNGDFETGAFAPWIVLGPNPAPFIASSGSGYPVHSGAYSAHVGSLPGGETPGDSSFYRQITVPPGGGTLSYWWYGRTVDSISFDWQDVYVTDATGTTPLATIMHVAQTTSGWVNVTYNMAGFAGQTVGIKFLVHGDNAGDPTDMFVDDVILLIPCPPTATATATATATPCASNVLDNGDFETGSFAPWVVQSSNPPPFVASTGSGYPVHSGTHSAHLGSLPGGETPGDSAIYETITVPPGGGTLSFWWYGRTVDSISFDWQDAYVTNSSGTPLATIMHVAQTTGGWVNVTYNMAGFAGQTVGIKFLVHGDNAGDPTDMFVDDVTLLVPCSSIATATTTTTATATSTSTLIPATNTPTASATNTLVPATNTSTATPTNPPTTTPTSTLVPATSTPTPSATNVPTNTATPTNTPTVTPTPTPITYGCSPGYWQNHTRNWPAPYTRNTKLNTVFTLPSCGGINSLGNDTFLTALGYSGGPTLKDAAKILLRQGVAALLNAASGIGYPLNQAQIISEVNTALNSCNRQTILDEAKRLDQFNNYTCPLN